MMKIVFILFAIYSPLWSFGKYEDTIVVKIKGIELKEEFTYYDCFLYDSTITDNNIILYYVFSNRKDSIDLKIGESHKLIATQESPCIFISSNDTLNFCRSCRVVFSDVYLGKRTHRIKHKEVEMDVIGRFSRIKTILN